MSEIERTLLPEVLPDPTVKPAVGSPRGRARARMEVLLTRASAGVMMTSCVGFGVVDPIPEPSCWQATGTGATGLARLANGDLEVVLTPQDTDWYGFESVVLISGGVEVSNTVARDEAVLVITPDTTATEVILEAQLSCSGEFGDTASGPVRFAIVLSTMSADWVAIESDP